MNTNFKIFRDEDEIELEIVLDICLGEDGSTIEKVIDEDGKDWWDDLTESEIKEVWEVVAKLDEEAVAESRYPH